MRGDGSYTRFQRVRRRGTRGIGRRDILAVVDTGLRADSPSQRVAYLNAGTDGPLPAAAVEAVGSELERELREVAR